MESASNPNLASQENNPPDNTSAQPQQDPAFSLPRIRTYSGDIQSAVKSGDVSRVKIVASEQAKKRAENPSDEIVVVQKKPIGLFLGYSLAIILFLVGGVGIFLFFQSQQQAGIDRTNPGQENQGLLAVNAVRPIGLEASDALPQIREKIANELSFISSGNGAPEFASINLFSIALDENGKRSDVTIELEPLLARLAMSDNGFSRLSEEYLYGVHVGTNPFLLVKVSDPDEAYGRLFEWESRLAMDMSPLFPSLNHESIFLENENTIKEAVETPAEETEEPIIVTEENTKNENTTPQPEGASSETTEETNTEEIEVVEEEKEEQIIFNPRTAKFEDVVFYNFDARVIRDNNGEVRFYYSFINPNLVLFGKDPKTISDINTELKNRTLSR